MNKLAFLLLMTLAPLCALSADDAALKLEELKRKAKELEGTYLSEEKKLKSIDGDMQRIQSKIGRVKKSIMDKQAQIVLLDQELAACETSLAGAEKGMRHQWVLLYKGASLDLINACHGHERYAGYINAVIHDRARAVREYQRLKEEREITRARAQELKGLLEKDLSELNDTVNELAAQRARKIRLVSSLKGQSKKYQDQIQSLLEEIQKGAQKGIEEGLGFLKSKGKLPWPVKGKVVRKFGPFTLQGVPQRSQGIDIEAQEGIEVRSIHPGKVVYFNWMAGYGNTLILDHGEGYYSVYGHLQEALKSVGETVVLQEIIGRVGLSGDVLRPTLHLEIRSHGKAQDPHVWLSRQ